jgi:cell division protein FtsZ
MLNRGIAHMGVGKAAGENRAMEAAKQAISSPLLETTINGATGVLLNITGGPSLTLFEVNEAADQVKEAADPDANIIFGAVIDEQLGDEVRITVIATGFDRREEPYKEVRKPEPVVERERERTPITRGPERNPDPVIDADADLDIPPFYRNQRTRR